MNDIIEEQVQLEVARSLHRLASQKYMEYHATRGEIMDRPTKWGKFIPAPEKRERYARFV